LYALYFYSIVIIRGYGFKQKIAEDLFKILMLKKCVKNISVKNMRVKNIGVKNGRPRQTC